MGSVPDRARHASAKPTIVVSHGAFHTSAHYELFASLIKALGHQCTVPQLPSASDDVSLQDPYDQDVITIHNAIKNEIVCGRNVVLVCHSYGGVPGPDALVGLPTTKDGTVSVPPEAHQTNRTSSPIPDDAGETPATPPPKLEESIANGHADSLCTSQATKLGKVLGIVFVSAFVADAGQSLVHCLGDSRVSWLKTEADDPRISYADPIAETFYNLCNDTDVRARAVDAVQKHLSQSYLTPSKSASWKEYPCVYVRCTVDLCLTPERQDSMILRLRQGRAERLPASLGVDVVELEADHVPFVSMPDKLAGWIDAISLLF